MSAVRANTLRKHGCVVPMMQGCMTCKWHRLAAHHNGTCCMRTVGCSEYSLQFLRKDVAHSGCATPEVTEILQCNPQTPNARVGRTHCTPQRARGAPVQNRAACTFDPYSILARPHTTPLYHRNMTCMLQIVVVPESRAVSTFSEQTGRASALTMASDRSSCLVIFLSS